METLSINQGVIKSIEYLSDFINLVILDGEHGLEEILVFDNVSQDFIGSRVKVESRGVYPGFFCFFPRFVDQDIYFPENPVPVKVRAYSRNILKVLSDSSA
jgi:hypothetical protein